MNPSYSMRDIPCSFYIIIIILGNNFLSNQLQIHLPIRQSIYNKSPKVIKKSKSKIKLSEQKYNDKWQEHRVTQTKLLTTDVEQ